MAEPLRRLPVYLVLDCSGSMSGEPIEAVRHGVRALLADLRGDPQALETAYLSVITFAGGAVQACPLTELTTFQEPNLTAGGMTALGAALRLLDQCVDAEVKGPVAGQQKGDWKPLVFLLTDGQPTDSWESAADAIRAKRLNVIALAAGDAADVNVLKRITERVVEMKSLGPGDLKAFFQWASASVKMAAAAGDGPLALPPPPVGIIAPP